MIARFDTPVALPMISSPGFPSVVFVLLLSTTVADFERRGISQISFSVTHGWSAFGGADHGWQDVELERRAWTLAQAVSGSVGTQGAAPDVSAPRIGADRPWRSQEHSADGEAACARRMRSIAPLHCAGVWDATPVRQSCLSKRIGSSPAALHCWG